MNTQINSLRSKLVAVVVATLVFAVTLAPVARVNAGPIDGGPDRIAFATFAVPTSD